MHAQIPARLAPAVLLAACAGLASAQCPAPIALTPGDPQAGAHVGSAAAIDTGYVLLGAPDQTVSGWLSAGEVSAYDAASGSFLTYLRPTDTAANASFGCAVALGAAHTWAIVGAPGLSTGAGAAYVFQRDPNGSVWTQNVKFDPGFSLGDRFGGAVAMNRDGTILAVAAPSRAIGANFNVGSVLAYSRSGSTWSYDTALFQADISLRHDNDFYGSSVGADGARVIVGVPYGDVPGVTDCGYVQIWTRSAGPSWSPDASIHASDAQPGDHFGYAVAMSGDTVAVGAPDAAVAGLTGSGAVYIYRYHQGPGWLLDGKISATDNLPSLGFGSSVAISGNQIVVGTGTAAQRTYIFRQAGLGWYQDARYRNPGGANADGFGTAVSIDAGTLVASAPALDRVNQADAGTAYVLQAPTEASDTYWSSRMITQGSYTGCTDDCTIDGTTSCGTGALQGPDVWYRYQAPASGTLTIDTQGSTLDTILSVHSENGYVGNSANTLACNDDFAPPARWSRVSVPVTAGMSYEIRIAGYGGATGSYTLNVGSVSACYANCDGSTQAPILNVLDFSCFLNRFAAGDPYANCDGSTQAPVLNVLDFSCFLNAFAAGCS